MTGTRSAMTTTPDLTPARAGIVASTALGLLLSIALVDATGTVLYTAYAGIGAYLVVRRPANSVGWWLTTIGWGLALGSVRVTAPPDALMAGNLTVIQAVATWVSGWGWGLVAIGLFGLLLVYPTGRLPGGRARWASVIVLGAMIGLAAVIAFSPTSNIILPGTGVAIDVSNPIALAPESAFWTVVPPAAILFGSQFLFILPALLMFLGRYRRSLGIERLQYRWLGAAIVVVLVAQLVWVVLTEGFEAYDLAWIPVVVAFPCVPVAIAIAVLRYRLFEIDRVISRTIGWALVTGFVVALFVGVVIALQAVLSGITQGDTLAVAASTLIAFAAFQPVRRRVQSAVDRRFDRARHDARGTVEAFSERLRDEMDLGTLRTMLLATADEAVRPSSATVWLRTGAAGR